MNTLDQSVINPAIISRAEHAISRANISESALKVLYRLKGAGFESYLVGGGVRDLLLGREPKDFDVATDASPEQVQALFRNCRLIGRRFRLAHVRFGADIVEVATFRATHQDDADEDDSRRDLTLNESGRILRDNAYGTLEQDAFRRDFSINALYYDIRDFSIVDYVGGMADLRAGQLRLIGDPDKRYREDPVRMLRAARFAAKLGFRLHPETERPIAQLASLLGDIPPARLFEEILKLFLYGFGLQAFENLRHHGLFAQLFPHTEAALSIEEQGFPHVFIAKALASTDARVAEARPVTPTFLFAALMWEPVRQRAAALQASGMHPSDAYRNAAYEVADEQATHVALPRRFVTPMIEIYQMQPRFMQREGKRPLRLLSHPRFRAAYDFLVLRAEAGDADQALADWWTQLQVANPEQQNGLLISNTASGPGNAPRRRRRSRRSGGG
ncbi:MAG TPA: polynucleotide adenylyltransferase PcnB [Gammaproteobacteria bacterium]|nr:polynucleotide adenylyltransferase PcnB [Gammaproteobacteria bacterium]